jgi:molecular chaperone GrpE (heat shock protein)
MKRSIQSVRAQVQAMLERAEALTGSDNEARADRYQDVADALLTVLDALDEADNALDA